MTTKPTRTETNRDAISGARILVGDMLSWSDLESLELPVAAREIVRSLVRAHDPRRVLLAGPRAALLIGALPTDIKVDIIVRGLTDIRLVGDRAGLHTDTRLFCGGFDQFPADARYDLVVGLGGPGRLLGPDSRGMGEAELVHALADRVDDGGHLVVDIANEMGVDDLLAAETQAEQESDEAWHYSATGFDLRHLYAAERDTVIADSGLSASVVYAAFPTMSRHDVLVDVARVDGPLAAQASLRVGLATLGEFSSVPTLRDPRIVLDRTIAAGLLDDLAPAWLVVASRGASTTELPALAAAEGGGEVAWNCVTLLDGAANATYSWADGHEGDEVSDARLSRRLGALRSSGRSFELELLRACATRRHASVRTHVRNYAAWLTDPQIWTRENVDQRWFATPANTVIDNGGFQIVDSTWRTTVTAGQDVFVRGMRDFARRLLASASAHPWRPTITPDDLTQALAAMAGITVTPSLLNTIARLEAEVETTRLGIPDRAAELQERNAEQGKFARDLPAADLVGFRELLSHDRNMARVLREKESQVAWLEGTLRHRDRYIRKLEKTIERFEETITYRTVQAMRAPRRIAAEKAVAVARSTARDALPDGALTKARRLATRVLK